MRLNVVPYIGTWIETFLEVSALILLGRTLYRYVDWNKATIIKYSSGTVVPYIGTWIETDNVIKMSGLEVSYLI